MADLSPLARSPLAGIAALRADAPVVTLAERPAAASFVVLARRGQAATLTERAGGHGLALPLTPRLVESRGVAVVATAPGQWLILCAGPDAEPARRLLAPFASLCTLVAVDDARVVLDVGGPRATDALAKMLTIDLHPRAFQPGEAAVTLAGGMSVIVWRTQEGVSLAVPRSYARSLWEWLVASSLEFGCATTTAEEAGGGAA